MPVSNSRKNLVAEIYKSLKEDILWLRLKPGEMFTEQYLAEIYQTSKTPVREALLRLANDQLVTVLPHKGYMVTDISYADLNDLFEYRSILECSCVEIASAHATVEQLDELERLAGELQAFNEDKPHFDQATFSNTDFHLCLVRLAGNRFLLADYIKTLERMQRFLWASTTEAVIATSIAEHFELVKLIRAKRVAEAQTLMRKHIGDILEAGLKKRRSL